jgi:hypothetical protein
VAVFRYAANLGRSFGYALPQIVKNKIPSVAELIKQVATTEGRSGIRDALSETRGILKEDVGKLLHQGYRNALADLKTGKIYKSEAEEDAELGKSFGASLGMDESAFDNSFLEGGDSSGGGAGIAAAAAVGAERGVRAAADALGDSPAMIKAAAAGVATSTFSRAQLGATLAVGNMLRNSVMANVRVLDRMSEFQRNVQRSYYEQSLEHLTSMRGLLSDVSEKLNSVISSTTVAAAASDQAAAMFAGTKGGDFSRLFDAGGGLNVQAYIGLLNTRLKNAVGQGSVFSLTAGTLGGSPIARALDAVVDGLVPRVVHKSLEEFEEFFQGFGALMAERASHFGRKLQGKGGISAGVGRFLQFIGVSPETVDRPDLSRTVKTAPVAFDGFAHRSIVEVIPSYLADIHSELVSIRVGHGYKPIGDRKLYKFETGRFTSERLEKASFQRGVDVDTSYHMSGTMRRVGVEGAATEEELEAIRGLAPAARRRKLAALRKKQEKIKSQLTGAFGALRDSSISITSEGTSDAFRAQLEETAAELDAKGRSKDAASLRASAPRLQAA